ncbi:MAG: acetate/propionate family kinase [Xanthobacteraceae bacterium]
MHVLVVNSGSSSIKYQLFDMRGEQVLAKGLIANIAPEESVTAAATEAPAPRHVKNHEEGLKELFTAIESAGAARKGWRLDAIGHRVVHGGPRFDAPVIIDDAVCQAIGEQAILAPLHNPANLAGILAARRHQPELPQVAVFDTAFHHGMPAIASTYALPRPLARQHGIRRYGFHGTNCAWSLAAAASYLKRDAESLNIIVAHLGAGASVTAIRAGRSVDTSMGMSPLEGLMMQTRCGDIDPAILLQLLRSGLSLAELDHQLNFHSGVMGICGEGDMLTVARRSLAGDRDAMFAREMYAYRASKYISGYAGIVWPLDALVFTAGIGENDSWVRAAVCRQLRHLGIKLDPALNDLAPTRDVRSVRAGPSEVDVLVVPANEELQIARETVATVLTAQSRTR